MVVDVSQQTIKEKKKKKKRILKNWLCVRNPLRKDAEG